MVERRAQTGECHQKCREQNRREAALRLQGELHGRDDRGLPHPPGVGQQAFLDESGLKKIGMTICLWKGA